MIGIPVPIVAISTGVAHNQYGDDDVWVVLQFYICMKYCDLNIYSCWIKTDKGAIWGFVVPMLMIILVRFL